QSQIPAYDTTEPVPKNSRKCPAPMRPVGRITRIINVRSTLGPEHLGLGMGTPYPLHPLRLSKISVPGDRLAVPADLVIIQLADSATPKVIVVINQPDLRLESGLFDGGTQVLPHELNFNFLGQEARRHSAVLIGVNFVLRRDRVDFDTLGLKCL